MLYDLEFVRFVDDKAEVFARHPTKLVGNTVTGAMAQANELLKTVALSPHPNAYRLRGENGAVIYVSGA